MGISLRRRDFPITKVLTSGSIDWSLSNQFSHSISTNQTYSFLNNDDGRAIVIKIQNTSSSSVTITWPVGITNPDTVIPPLSTKLFTIAKFGTNTYMNSMGV